MFDVFCYDGEVFSKDTDDQLSVTREMTPTPALEEIDLHYVTRSGDTSCLQVLLSCDSVKYIPNINRAFPYRPRKDSLSETTCSALWIAVMEHHTEVVRILLTHPDLQVNCAGNEDGDTVLIYACSNYFVDLATELVRCSKIDVNAQNQSGYTALMSACTVGSTEIVRLLLTRTDLDLNRHSFSGYTALMCACAIGHLFIVKLLLEQPGIDVNARDSRGQTALMLACMEGFGSVVQCLLDDGRADVHSTDKRGRSAVYHAWERGHTTITALIHEKDSTLTPQVRSVRYDKRKARLDNMKFGVRRVESISLRRLSPGAPLPGIEVPRSAPAVPRTEL